MGWKKIALNRRWINPSPDTQNENSKCQKEKKKKEIE